MTLFLNILPTYPVHILALQCEGMVPGEDEPVIMLYDQHLCVEPLAVLLDTALVQGYPQLVVLSTICVKKTGLGPEIIDYSKYLFHFILLCHEAPPCVDDPIKVLLHLDLHHHVLPATAELHPLKPLMTGLNINLLTHILLPHLSLTHPAHSRIYQQGEHIPQHLVFYNQNCNLPTTTPSPTIVYTVTQHR